MPKVFSRRGCLLLLVGPHLPPHPMRCREPLLAVRTTTPACVTIHAPGGQSTARVEAMICTDAALLGSRLPNASRALERALQILEDRRPLPPAGLQVYVAQLEGRQEVFEEVRVGAPPYPLYLLDKRFHPTALECAA